MKTIERLKNYFKHNIFCFKCLSCNQQQNLNLNSADKNLTLQEIIIAYKRSKIIKYLD